MTNTAMPSHEILENFGLSDPVFVVTTGIAMVWRVRCADGREAALKLYHGRTMGNESTGFVYLKALDGVGAARVYRYTDRSAVIEWLSGPSLGDLTRAGEDTRAAKALVEVARTLHSAPLEISAPLPELEAWFGGLLSLDVPAGTLEDARHNLMRCQALARQLLSTQHDIRPLHGDLHHDNVRLGARGYCAFDAKGVLGERTYELANAFRNPKGAPDVVRDPARIRYLRDLWSDLFEVDPTRLMQWAAVKCALSIAWRRDETGLPQDEFDLLECLLAIAEAG
ncbi:MAG: aminoglycoside phosphotransferase family protein [Pseudomonadota bacterium]